MADKHHYTRHDMERYLAGNMPEQEMHAFEKAMLSDPFLADAFEGYRNANPTTTRKNLDWITKQVQGAPHSARVVAMASRKSGWLRFTGIAASIIIVASAGYLWMRDDGTTPTSANQEMAATMQADTTAPLEINTADSTLLATQPAPATLPESPPKKEKENVAALSARPTRPMAAAAPPTKPAAIDTPADPMAMAMAADMAEDESREKAARAAMEKQVTARAMKVESAPPPGRVFKGKVVDNNGEPVPFATVIADSNNATIADADGQFSIRLADSMPQVKVIHVGWGTVESKLAANRLNRVTMPEQNTSLSELVMTRKPRSERNVRIEGGAIPVKGWTDFEEYLAEKIEQVQDTSDTYHSGPVVLEFDVGKKGQPENIVVFSATNNQHVQAAIDILRNGPRWKAGRRSAKGRVTINF